MHPEGEIRGAAPGNVSIRFVHLVEDFRVLHFHKFYKRQVIIAESVFWLGKVGPGRG
jgi:hypothetical protein